MRFRAAFGGVDRHLAIWVGYGFVAAPLWVGLLSLAHSLLPARSYPMAAKITGDVDLTGKVVIVTDVTFGIGVDTP